MGIIKIDKNKEVTGKLGFEVFPEFNDLGVGYLTDVEVTENESKDDAKWEFAGMKIPVLNFRFQQYKRKATDKDRFMTISFMPISNQLADGTNREESRVVKSYIQMFDKIKHLHDQYAGNDNFAPLATDFEFNSDGTIAARLKEFKKVFESVVKDFKVGKDGKTPIYKDKQYLAIVLVASGKKLSYLAIPGFVNKGIFDLFKTTDGKIDTYLRIPANETTKLGISAPVAPTSTANSELPTELQDLINQG
jgi:hypothetical protein